MNAEAYLIDKAHREKRKKNIRMAMIFIYTLIFIISMSLGHSLITERDLLIAKQEIQALEIENELLRAKVKE